MNIKAYLKPHCGWSRGMRAIFEKYELKYEDIDIINYPENYAEMVEKSGQPLSPCVEIDGIMLADVSGEEVEAYMLKNKLVKPNDTQPKVSINSSCTPAEHAKMAKEQTSEKPIRFF